MERILVYGKAAMYDNYTAAIAAGGGIAVRQGAAACAALVLPGGGDIGKSLDGEEAGLIESFIRNRRPILGICRGMQALNVYFGGALENFVPGHQAAEDIVHPTCCRGLLRQLLGKAPAVNSNHHQAVRELGQGLQALQWSADGVIEGLGHETLPILGVQWHPERQSFARRRRDAADGAAVFYWLMKEAQQWRNLYGS